MTLNPVYCVAALAAYVTLRLFLGALNRMTRGVPQPIRCAVALLILPGAFGKALGPWLDGWGEYADLVDLLLLGGVALLFAVDRRLPDEPPAPRWQLMARVVVIAIVILGGFGAVASSAHAQELENRAPTIRSMQGCVTLSHWILTVADMRDVGSVKSKHLELIRQRNAEQHPAIVAILVREAARVYDAPRKPREELSAEGLERCMLGALNEQGSR